MVELMIVIAIIAVLASIIMPKMTQARQRSQLAACKDNLRLLGVALEMYAHDNNNLYPIADGGQKIKTTFILYTGGYITTIVKCPVYNTIDPAYWLQCNAPYDKATIYAPYGDHTPLGLPSGYPRLVTGYGVIDR